MLKGKFATGQKPTGSDFAELIDSSVLQESELAGGGRKFPANERIHLSTDQKWVMSEGHLSDLIRLQWTAERAKPALVWVDEQGNDKTAIISHYKANDPTRIDHRHISIETTMSPTGALAGELHTRLELPFDADVCEIQTHDSNFTVESGKLRISGENGTNRDMIFCRGFRKEDNQNEDGTPNYNIVYSPRWSVRSDSTAESGGNSGSDFRVVRYNDNNEALDTPFFIKRSSGNVGLGTQSPQRRLDINDSRIRLQKSFTPASSTATGLQGDIAWDADYVYVCVADNTWKRTALETW